MTDTQIAVILGSIGMFLILIGVVLICYYSDKKGE